MRGIESIRVHSADISEIIVNFSAGVIDTMLCMEEDIASPIRQETLSGMAESA